MKKIQCGGFYVDDEAIETRDGKPYLKTGGNSGGSKVLQVIVRDKDDENGYEIDTPQQDAFNAMLSGTPLVVYVMAKYLDGEQTTQTMSYARLDSHNGWIHLGYAPDNMMYTWAEDWFTTYD